MGVSGNVLKSEIVGSVKMKCYLSGMPELRLGLNDKVLFENTGSKLLHVDAKIRYVFFLFYDL